MNPQLLLRDTIGLSTSCFPSLDNSLGDTKRYAMYIPQSFFENAREILAQVDAESTWEFPASISPSKSISSESSSSPPSTPAQEIVIRYRAGMPLHFEGDEPRSDISVDDGANSDEGPSATFCFPVESPKYPRDDTFMVGITKTEIKFPHGPSCRGLSEALKKTAPPAIQMRGFREANSVACPSFNVLRTLVNQMFQPHIHDVQEGCRRRMACSPSPKSHEIRQELQDSVHRGRSFMGSAFRSIVTRIWSKLSRSK